MLEESQVKSKPKGKPKTFWIGAGILAILVIVLVVIFTLYAPVGVDWQETFHVAAQNWHDPYDGTLFTNPPWALLLIPHAFFDLRLGNAINMLLNFAVLLLVIRKFGGGTSAIILVFTSPFIIDLARTNNIDWIPALSLLLEPTWGLILLAVKPQSIGAVALIWWKEQNFSWKMLVPTLVLLGISFLVYGLWVTRLAGLPDHAGYWNIAPFPFGIPLGIYLLYIAYCAKDAEDGVVLAALATAFLTPYVAPYSLNTVMALGASRYRREAFIVWVASWIYVIYTARRMALAGA